MHFNSVRIKDSAPSVYGLVLDILSSNTLGSYKYLPRARKYKVIYPFRSGP